MRCRSCASVKPGSSAGRAGSARGAASATPTIYCSRPIGAPHDGGPHFDDKRRRLLTPPRPQRRTMMAEISRVALFGKLNSLGYRAIEAATVFCKLRGNPYVELVHWVHQILQLQDSDLHRILKEYGVSASTLAKDLTAALDRLPRGATSVSDLSSHVEE